MDGRTDASGNGSPRRVRITVPEQYRAVSDEVWTDLEEYLFRGFLSSPAHVLGKTFVFKTINHFELENVSFLRPLRQSPPEVAANYQAAFIAHSVFIADGVNTLHGRADHMAKLVRIFHKVRPEVQEEIVSQLSALNGRAARLHPLVEVYVHENRSRYRWLQLRDLPVHSTAATGIAGTEGLGMNYVQQTWTALNRLLDQRDRMEADWTNAKFVGSCFNGKGVRSVDQRDRARKEKERHDREDLKMNVLFRYLNRKAGREEEAPAQVQLPDGRMATVSKRFRAESVESLRDQLEAALNGEKDHHDTVVERRMAQIQRRQEVLEQERQRMYRGSALRPGQYESTSVPLHGPSRVLGGKAEAEAHLARMREVRNRFLARQARQIPGDLQSSDGAPLREYGEE